MHRLRLTALLLVLAPAAGVAAPGVEHWGATSTTAMAITGDIALSPTRLAADGKVFTLKVAADVPDFATNTGPHAARILRVTSSRNPVLKNGNRLCDTPARWIAVYRSAGGTDLNLSVFTGSEQPTGEIGKNVCGTFLYSR